MGAHVLIVEDSALVVGALRILLEDSGYRVSSAGSVREALETAMAEMPDVMLLDLTLPDGDGLAVLEGMTATGNVPTVTVAVTGRDEPSVIQRCLDTGCREVLIKPMSALQLPRQIARWLAEPPGGVVP